MTKKQSPMAKNEEKLKNHWRKYGELYGFPSCCIEAFCEGKQCHGDEYFSGSGFLRGPCCINKDPREVLKTVQENRKFKHPFPFDKEDKFDLKHVLEYFLMFFRRKEYMEKDFFLYDIIKEFKEKQYLGNLLKGTITFVGSREVTTEEQCELYTLAYGSLLTGLNVSTGCAEGSDRASYRAYEDWSKLQSEIPSLRFQMWLPKEYSRGFKADNKNFFVLNDEMKRFAYSELQRAGITWFDNMKTYAQELYLRNVFQIWLRDYSQTSLIICCADETNPNPRFKKVKGGTNIAVQVALRNSIPVLNIRNEKDRKSLRLLVGMFTSVTP